MLSHSYRERNAGQKNGHLDFLSLMIWDNWIFLLFILQFWKNPSGDSLSMLHVAFGTFTVTLYSYVWHLNKDGYNGKESRRVCLSLSHSFSSWPCHMATSNFLTTWQPLFSYTKLAQCQLWHTVLVILEKSVFTMPR